MSDGGHIFQTNLGVKSMSSINLLTGQSSSKEPTDYYKFVSNDKLMLELELYSVKTNTPLSVWFCNVLGNINYYIHKNIKWKPYYDINKLSKLSTSDILKFKNFGRKHLKTLNNVFKFYGYEPKY